VVRLSALAGLFLTVGPCLHPSSSGPPGTSSSGSAGTTGGTAASGTSGGASGSSNSGGSSGAAIGVLSCVDAGFAAQLVEPVGAGPFGAAVGNFGGSGALDLAVANAHSGTVSILMNDGTGTFGAQVTYSVGGAPVAVALADFNFDGSLDLAVANNATDSVDVLLGGGGGTFGAPTAYSAGLAPTAVAVGDFNGDRWPDLAVASGGGVSVLLNAGTDGGFAAQMAYPLGLNPAAVAVGDLNGDGWPDLAVVTGGTELDVDAGFVGLNVLLNNGTGDGTFAAAMNYPIQPGSNAVVIADFNGDGRPDILVESSFLTLTTQLTVFLNQGAGTFVAQPSFPEGQPKLGEAGSGAAVADFNGDGRLDVACSNQTPNSVQSSVSVFLGEGEGDGGFGQEVDYPSGHWGSAVVAGDFNGDGRPDLAVVNYADDTVSVLLNGCAAGGCTGDVQCPSGDYCDLSIAHCPSDGGAWVGTIVPGNCLPLLPSPGPTSCTSGEDCPGEYEECLGPSGMTYDNDYDFCTLEAPCDDGTCGFVSCPSGPGYPLWPCPSPSCTVASVPHSCDLSCICPSLICNGPR
jgi:hypothetical protein